MNNLLLSWKSTIGGILTISLAALWPPSTMSYVAPGQVGLTFKQWLVISCVAAAMKAAVSSITQDADKVVAIVPRGEKKVVDASPVTTNPENVRVTEKEN